MQNYCKGYDKCMKLGCESKGQSKCKKGGGGSTRWRWVYLNPMGFEPTQLDGQNKKGVYIIILPFLVS